MVVHADLGSAVAARRGIVSIVGPRVRSSAAVTVAEAPPGPLGTPISKIPLWRSGEPPGPCVVIITHHAPQVPAGETAHRVNSDSKKRELAVVEDVDAVTELVRSGVADVERR